MSNQHARVWQTSQQEQVKQKPSVIRRKVKVHKPWVTRGEKVLYIIFAIVFLSFSAYLITYSSSVDKLNREIQVLNTQVDQAEVHTNNLAYQVKELSQPQRIIENAKEHGLKIQNTKVKQASEITE